MRQREFLESQHFNTIHGHNINQSIPIVLPISDEVYTRVKNDSALALVHNNNYIAILRNPEFYGHRKEEREARTFGTTAEGHPYIKVRYHLRSSDAHAFEKIIFIQSSRLTIYSTTLFKVLKNNCLHMNVSDSVCSFHTILSISILSCNFNSLILDA